MKKLIIIFSLLLISLVGYGQPETQKIRNKLRVMDDFTVDGVSFLNGNIQLVNLATITNDDANIMTLTEPTIAFIGRITALKTTEQFRLLYDADNYLSVTLLDDGHTTFVTVDPDGAEADIVFMPDGNVGIGTENPRGTLEVNGPNPGNVGGFSAGVLQVTAEGTSQFIPAVITGHNSYSGNTQLWYLGSMSSSEDNICFMNRQNADLSLWTNNIERMTILGAGAVDVINDFTAGSIASDAGVTVATTLQLTDLATGSTEVLSPDASGDIVTLATADIGDIAIDHSGGMTWVSTPGTQTIGTGETFERLNEGAIAYTASHLHDFTHSDGRLTYTGTNTKHFCVAVFPNIESHEASAKVQIRIALNGTTIAGTNQAHDYRSTDTDAVIPTKWLLELSTNDYIELFGTSDTSSDTFELLSGQIIISEH